MDQTITLIVSSLVGALMVILIAPRVLAANRGVALRNIALWVGIFLLLSLAYKVVGPGRPGAQLGKAEQEQTEGVKDPAVIEAPPARTEEKTKEESGI